MFDTFLPAIEVDQLFQYWVTVGSMLINKMQMAVTSIDGVTNLVSATGGLDQEEDDDFEKLQW